MSKDLEHDNHQVILVKLGGSVITDKDNLKAANIPKIEQLTDEIHRSRRDYGKKMIIGNGAGSFGHPPASRYRTIEGLVHSESRRGMIEVRTGGGETIPVIDQSNIRSVTEVLSPPSAMDVTGGMTHKINEAFKLAKRGIPTLIISSEANNLYKALSDSKNVEGTLIRFSST